MESSSSYCYRAYTSVYTIRDYTMGFIFSKFSFLVECGPQNRPRPTYLRTFHATLGDKSLPITPALSTVSYLGRHHTDDYLMFSVRMFKNVTLLVELLEMRRRY